MDTVLKNILVCATTGIVAYFFYYTVLLYLKKSKYRHIPGPPEHGVLGFYLGQVLYMARLFQKGKIIPDALLEWLNKYGPVIHFNFLNDTIILTTDVDAIREILITADFPKDPKSYQRIGFPLNERFLGKGLVTEYDKAKWHERRSLFNAAFHKQSLMSFIDEFNAKGEILMNRFRTLADGKTKVTLLDEFNHATLDVIASIAFGMNVDSINDPETKLNKYILESLRGINYEFLEPYIKYLPHKWYLVSKYKQSVKLLREMGKEQILNRIKLIENGENVPHDILTTILKTNKDENLDLDAIVDDFSTFFMAGQETSANTLAFVFMLLGQHQDVLQKCRKEVDEVIGSRRDLNFEDISRLKYISCVIKETLRIYPPVLASNRIITKPMKIQGYNIPVGSLVMVSPYACGNYSKNFPNPSQFKPERFMNDENSTKTHQQVSTYTYFPFSIGPRNCIGQNFAQIEIKILIAKIIQNFDFELVKDQSFNLIQVGTIRTADGTKCLLKLRN